MRHVLLKASRVVPRDRLEIVSRVSYGGSNGSCVRRTVHASDLAVRCQWRRRPWTRLKVRRSTEQFFDWGKGVKKVDIMEVFCLGRLQAVLQVYVTRLWLETRVDT